MTQNYLYIFIKLKDTTKETWHVLYQDLSRATNKQYQIKELALEKQSAIAELQISLILHYYLSVPSGI